MHARLQDELAVRRGVDLVRVQVAALDAGGAKDKHLMPDNGEGGDRMGMKEIEAFGELCMQIGKALLMLVLLILLGSCFFMAIDVLS